MPEDRDNKSDWDVSKETPLHSTMKWKDAPPEFKQQYIKLLASRWSFCVGGFRFPSDDDEVMRMPLL